MKGIGSMMKQVQQMQSKMQEIQEKMDHTLIEGTAGGGMVKVTINGKGEAQKIEIEDSLLSLDEKEVLEDLIIAAFGDARKKMDEKMSDEMGSLGIPKGMGLPF